MYTPVNPSFTIQKWFKGGGGGGGGAGRAKLYRRVFVMLMLSYLISIFRIYNGQFINNNICTAFKLLVQSNFNGSNIFRTTEILSKQTWFEPLRNNHSASRDENW